MKSIILLLLIIIIRNCWAQDSISLARRYTGPFEFIVAPTYSGLDEIGINLDSCVISLQDSLTINIHGILVDHSTLERIPFADVAIGIDSTVDKIGMESHFIPTDTSKTDSIGRFDISSKIVDHRNSTFTFSFPGYYRYYLKLKKIFSKLKKP